MRRIRHKIFVGYVTQNKYLAIFRRVYQEFGMVYDEVIVRDMMNRYYVATAHPLSACHLWDLLENMVDRARFLGQEPALTAEKLDSVCQTYFIKPTDICDYDTICHGGEARPLD